MTTQQLAVLHVAKKQLGLDDDTYRDILKAHAGVRSAKDLDTDGFENVMRYLKLELGFRPTGKAFVKEAVAPGDLPTPKQLGALRGLYERLGWTDTARQRAFNERVIKSVWPQTRRDASKLIEALKNMNRRDYSERKGATDAKH